MVTTLLLFTVTCLPGQRAEVQVINEQKAREAVIDFISKHAATARKRPVDYDFEAKRFGGSTWLVHATFTKESVADTVIYIVDGDGAREATLQNLVYAHAREFPVSSDEKDHRKIIDSVLKLHSSLGHGHSAVLISSTKDIPGYDDVKKGIHGNRIGRPLDDDFQRVIRPSWKEEWPTSGYLFYVVYTYNRMGGVVSRYKVQFNATSRDERGKLDQWRIYTADHIVLGKMVGDFKLR